jgi:L-amino acid N-acyltransferase YncA
MGGGSASIFIQRRPHCCMVVLFGFSWPAAYAGAAEISIYVHENSRHQGFGSCLLAEAVKAAPALGIHTLTGLIFGHNRPSLQLFAKAGFQQWAQLPRIAEMDGHRYDLVIVGLSLS